MNRLRRLTEFLTLKKSMVGMLGMVVLVGMGEHMAERFLPLYLQQLTQGFTFKISLGLISIGLLGFLDDLLSALYSFPGGYLSDRMGTKRALLLFNALSMVGYLVVIIVQTWWAVLVGAAFFISWSAISLPATMELIAKVVPKNRRTMGVSVQALVRRIPKMLGPVLGGTFIAVWGVVDGVRYAFVVALGLALVALVMQQVLIEDDRPNPEGKKQAEKNPFRLFPLMHPDLRNLLVSDILIRFCERIPDLFVVLWATQAMVSADPVSFSSAAFAFSPPLVRLAANLSVAYAFFVLLAQAAFLFGILSAIEHLTAVLCYVPVAHMADRFGKKPFVAITFGFFTAFPLALYFCHSFWPLVAVFVLRGLKEFGEPTRKALIMDLAPEDRKAAMFGLYYLIRDVIVAAAAFGGALLWMISPAVNLFTAFAFGVIGTTWFITRGRDLTPRQHGTTATS